MGMRPGMIGRITQDTIKPLKDVFYWYANTDMFIDAGLPHSYTYVVDTIPFLKWNITWTDIQYSNLHLDMDQVKTEFIHDGNIGLLFFDFPALKEWNIEANEHINTLLFPTKSHVELNVKDFNIDFETEFAIDTNGYLDPVVQNVYLDFGNSRFHHDNFVIQFIVHQTLELSCKALEVTAKLVGRYMFSQLLGPVMDHYFNHYLWWHI